MILTVDAFKHTHFCCILVSDVDSRSYRDSLLTRLGLVHNFLLLIPSADCCGKSYFVFLNLMCLKCLVARCKIILIV